MKWGITCFFARKADFSVIKEIAPAYPLDYLEIRGERPFFSPDDLTTEELAFFREVIGQSGLKVTLHSTFYDINLASFNSSLKQANLECYKKYLDLGADLGAEILVVHAGYLHRDAAGEPSLRQLARQTLLDNLRQLGDYAEVKGLTIGLENSPPNKNMLMIPGWQEHLNILQELNHPRVKALFDMAHAYLHGLDLQEYYQRIKPWLMEIHAHNNDGREDQHLSMSRGKIDYRAFFRKTRPEVPIIMEIRNFDEAIESLEWIRAVERET